MTESLDHKSLENAAIRQRIAQWSSASVQETPVQAAERTIEFICRLTAMAADAHEISSGRNRLQLAGYPHEAFDRYLIRSAEKIQEEFRKTFGHEMIWKEPE